MNLLWVRGGNVHLEERFHLAEAADVTREMKTQIRGNAGAEKNVVAEIVDSQFQIGEREREPVVLKIGPAGRFRITQPKNRELGHRSELFVFRL